MLQSGDTTDISENTMATTRPTTTPTTTYKKRKIGKTPTSADNSIDAAINKLTSISDQDMYDNFGNLVASQLKSIPLEDALKLQQDINQMITNRLIQINRRQHSSSPPSTSQPSRPASSSIQYSNSNTIDDITSPSTADTDMHFDDTDHDENDTTTDIISRAFRGIMEND